MILAFAAYVGLAYGLKVAVKSIPIVNNINIVGNIIASIGLIYAYHFFRVVSDQAIVSYFTVVFLIILNFSLIYLVDKFIARNKVIVFNHIWLATILFLTPSIIMALFR